MDTGQEDCPGFVPASQMMGKTESDAPSTAVAESQDMPANEAAEHLDGAPVVKRRRVHLDACQIESHASTQDGARALTDPLSIPKSSKDPNRGLYPRLPDLPNEFGFKSASALMKKDEACLPELSQSNPGTSSQSYPPFQSRASKKLPPQKNNLMSYFSTVPSTSPTGSPAGSPLKVKAEIKSEYDVSGTGAESTVKVEVKSEIKTESFTPSGSSQSGPSNTRKGTSSTRGKRSKPGRAPTFNRDNAFLYDTTLAKPSTSKSKFADDSKFGLFGNADDVEISSDEDDDLAYFDSLPTELVENILCRLPLADLLLNVCLVCQRWNDIICGSNFVPWKKKYHRLKLEDMHTRNFLDQELRKHGCMKREDYLPGLVRILKSIRKKPRDMSDGLAKHHLYECAVAVIKERLPDCIEDDVPHPYSVIAMLVILSESVSDITKIIRCLLDSSSCTAMELLECLYCIATYLLRFKLLKAAEVWNGMHYRLFYALYLYENESCTTAKELKSSFAAQSGQQSIMKYSQGTTSVQMTHEQLRICKHELQPNDVVKIVAFAGTGKTTTLVKYTQMRPNKKFLLVVYNKSVSEHAKTKFPSNVTVKTGHSLAFGYTGRRYKAGNKLVFGKLKLDKINDHFKARKGEALYVQSQFILDTINAFQASADFEIDLQHAPTHRMGKDGKQQELDLEFKQWYVQQARNIWAKMHDYYDKSMPITHDGYLKAYQLTRPVIRGYDVILIDEAQDMTPSLAWVLFQQTQPKVLVGDPHQQIYSFRGATNAMQRVDATHTYYLTQSFRFGPEISYVANNCLEFLKKETKKTLVGNGIPGAIDGSVEGQLCIISRCNYTLFNEAVRKLCYNNSDERPAFVGGTEGFGFDMILDIYLLLLPPEERMQKAGRGINNGFIGRFRSLDSLEEFATKTADPELLGKIKIVKSYLHQIPSLLSTIRRKCIKDVDCADLVFSTAHKAKGLEFPTVRITDDFKVGMNSLIGGPQNLQDENNILYVAITRAKKRLILNQTLMMTLGMVGEKFLFPKYSKELKDAKASFVCYKSNKVFEPMAATLARRMITIESGVQKGGGYLSPKTINREFPAWTHLLGAIKGEDDEEDSEEEYDNPMEEDFANFGFNILRGMQMPIGQFIINL